MSIVQQTKSKQLRDDYAHQPDENLTWHHI